VRSLTAMGWIAAGQVVAALSTLVGMRLLTGVVLPETFGQVTLLVGAAGLAVNLLCTPLSQAVLHEFSASKSSCDISNSKSAFAAALVRSLTIGLSPVLICALLMTMWAPTPMVSVLLMVGIVCFDSWRTAGLIIANASHAHKLYAAWFAADAVLKPMLALIGVWIFGSSSNVVLAGYFMAGIVLMPMSWRVLPPQLRSGAAETLIRNRLWSYALPLLPLGIIGWVTGLADRYVIAGTMGLAKAGIYAAAAALASRPILMFGSTLELFFRPKYQEAVHGDSAQAKRYINRWVAMAVAGGGATLLALTLWHQQIAALLLGPDFRAGSKLMPLIAIGYVFLIVSYVFERICYARARTARVLYIQMFTAAAALASLYIGAYFYGLIGAAIAVPVYYSVQLCGAFIFARATQKEFALSLRKVAHD
jgi:O-antigen/teichoic acid export membrane protein